MSQRHATLSYVLKRPPDGGALKASTTCSGCPRGESVNVNNVMNRPEQIRQLFERKGWEFDPHNASRNLCPVCIAARAERRRGESPKESHKPLNGRTTTVTAPPAAPTATPDQRMKIRNLLDANFDDAKGRYLAGYSDERIAQEVNVPRRAVTNLREAAYGELRTDPEIEALTAAAAVCETKIKQAQDRIDQASEDLKDIRQRLANFQLSKAA